MSGEEDLPFCSECGTKLERYANYCSKCRAPIGFKKDSANSNFFDNTKNFIIQSRLEKQADTGCIKDLDNNILAFFWFTQIWKPPRTKDKRMYRTAERGLTADFWFETVDKTFVGEIYGFPIFYSYIRRNSYEIYNAENRLLGIVWEKIRGFRYSWELEDAQRRLIATVDGSRKRKDYDVIDTQNQIVARCYRTQGMDKNSYKIDVLSSELDTFLILAYIIVLDRVKRYPQFHVNRGA